MYDSSPLTVNGISISNVEGESCRMCTIAEALKRSLNTSFYRMQLQMATARRRSPTWPTRQHPQVIPGVGQSLTEPDDGGPTMASCSASTSPRSSTWHFGDATFAASGVSTRHTSCSGS